MNAGGVFQFGVPPLGNVNFASAQHFILRLTPRGTVGYFLADGSMSSEEFGETFTLN